MSAPSQSTPSHNAHVEDSEDDIEVLVFRNSGCANNTINTTAVNTNNEQSNISTVRRPRSARRSLRRSSPTIQHHPRMVESPSGRVSQMTITGSLTRDTERIANDSNSPTGRQSLFGGPYGDNPNIVRMDQLVENLLKEEPRSTAPTQAPRTTTSKVTKSNSTHIALFNTLSPIQKLGRRNKMNSIGNKLKDKTCEELTKLYNSTEDPDFRRLMSEVYYENCMERLDDWERKL